MTLKLTWGIRQWWFHILVCFSEQAYGFFRLPLGILLNQDGKWLHAWEMCSNHSGSANCRLQYWAELLRSPANRGRVPALLLSATGKEGKPAQPLTRLAFPITALESSRTYLLKPSMLHYWLFLIKRVGVIFSGCRFSLCHSADYCKSTRWWK